MRDYSSGTAAFRGVRARDLPLEAPEYFGTSAPIAELMTVPELRAHIAELADSGVNVVPARRRTPAQARLPVRDAW